MHTVQKTFAVALTIPDNAAYTAAATLRRLGLPVAGVDRADIWTFDVEPASAAALAGTIADIETIFNPNKHRLTERPGARPLAGEVWIAPQTAEPAARVGGLALPGVDSIARCVGWRLLDQTGAPVADDVLASAIETFLCNAAFEKARR